MIDPSAVPEEQKILGLGPAIGQKQHDGLVF